MSLIDLKVVKVLLVLVLAVGFSACSNNLQTRVSGNLGKLSSLHTVAILPVEVQSDGQMELATMFRQNLHANLRQSSFKILEHYIVDGQLKNHNLMDPSKYGELDPMRFGEVLGVDAVLLSRINQVQKTYFLIHSSIEISVSVEMIDTRTGEILWVAEQTESDIQGIAKIPTGIASAVIAPIYLVTSKLMMNELTANLANKLTSIVKYPNEANPESTFNEAKIAAAWNGGKAKEKQEVYWAEVVGVESSDKAKIRPSHSVDILKDGLKQQIPYEIVQQKPVQVSASVNASKESGGLKLTPLPKKVIGQKAKDPSISF